MSDPSNKKLMESSVSNEDIINELTKDLQSSLIKEEGKDDESNSPSSSDEPFVINPDGHFDDVPNSNFPKSKTNEFQDFQIPNEINEFPDFHMPNKNTKEKEHEKLDVDKSDESDDDSDNEIELKDLEVTLNEEEKNDRRKMAEELKNGGNEQFKLREFELSIDKYSEGLRLCPLSFTSDRAVLYSNRAAAKMKLSKNKEAIKDCTKAIDNDPNYNKAYFRRAQCYELTNQFDESLADFKKVLELDPDHAESKNAVRRLPALIEERNEKLKTEMLGKLKDLGNMILKPFGLSTENFQMTQDPETKGYSVNFQQGKK